MRAESKAALQKLAEQAGLRDQAESVHLLRGEPHVVVPNFIQDRQIDLVVMGTVARRGIEGILMGNTAELILNAVQCSVLAVKLDDFICPVKKRARKSAGQSAEE